MAEMNEDTEAEGQDIQDPNSPDAIVDAILNGGPSAQEERLADIPGEEGAGEPAVIPDPHEADAAPVSDEAPVEVPEDHSAAAPPSPELAEPDITPELQSAAQAARMQQLEAENEMLRGQPQVPAEAPQAPVRQESGGEVPLQWQEYRATDEDAALLAERPKEFITSLVNFVGSEAVRQLHAGIEPAVGQTIQRMEEIRVAASEAARQFYTGNKDLVGYEEIVGAVSAQVQLKNPGKSYDDITDVIATTARSLLKQHGVNLGPTVPLATNMATPGARQMPGITASSRNEEVESVIGFDSEYPA